MNANRRPARGRQASFPALEWLEEACGAQPRLLLAGGARAMIENLTGILEFTPQRIRLMTKAGCLTLTGDQMLLTQVRKDALIICGRIDRIAFPGDCP